jgi:hypothetical protein
VEAVSTFDKAMDVRTTFVVVEGPHDAEFIARLLEVVC